MCTLEQASRPEDNGISMTKLQHKISQFLATNPTEIAIEIFFLEEVLPYDKRSMTEILDEEVRQMYKVYEGYQVVSGVLELDEEHPHNYVVTEDELVERFVEATLELQGDTEDPMREWLISQPEIGEILHGHPSDLPIKRIA